MPFWPRASQAVHLNKASQAEHLNKASQAEHLGHLNKGMLLTL